MRALALWAAACFACPLDDWLTPLAGLRGYHVRALGLRSSDGLPGNWTPLSFCEDRTQIFRTC